MTVAVTNVALRQSMSLLHTWAGLLLGSVLFAVFWMGTLSVFDREIDRWMIPAARVPLPASLSLDGDLWPVVDELHRQHPLQQWGATLPEPRSPYYRLFYQDGAGRFHSALVVAGAGLLEHPGTLGATRFIFPFHYRLNLDGGAGIWLVGLAAMAMLVLLVSGVIVHRKVLRECFVFRPEKRAQRAALDLHNLSGVLALPFHAAITLSGLIVFMGVYFPDAARLAYAGEKNPAAAFFAESADSYRRAAAGQPAGARASLDALRRDAETRWGDAVGFVRVRHAGDHHAVVELGRSVRGEVSWNIDKRYYDAASGELLHSASALPLMQVQRFLVGMHFIQFEHWPLRWLYFLGGLGSCVMIATGLLFWVQARRARPRHSCAGLRTVEALSVGATVGIIAATLGFFVANRLLPAQAVWAGIDRAGLEVGVFYLVWLCSFAHAALRPWQQAFAEQCQAIAVLALAAVLLNAFTGDHLLHSILHRQWAVAGMDTLLLAAACGASVAAARLRSRGPRARCGRHATR